MLLFVPFFWWCYTSWFVCSDCGEEGGGFYRRKGGGGIMARGDAARGDCGCL